MLRVKCKACSTPECLFLQPAKDGFGADGVTQVVELLPTKCKVPSSNSNTRGEKKSVGNVSHLVIWFLVSGRRLKAMLGTRT